MNIDVKSRLDEIGLNPDSAIVIGSGILGALHIRDIHDIDLVVTEEAYGRLVQDSRFKKTETHGREILTYGVYEIGINWAVMGKSWDFASLSEHSTVIDGVRYIDISFLLDVKRSWTAEGDVRQKDLDDIQLIEDYIKK